MEAAMRSEEEMMHLVMLILSLYDIVKPHIISFHKIYAHLRSKGKFEQWSERSERNCSNFRRTAPKCDIISLNTVDFLFCPAA